MNLKRLLRKAQKQLILYRHFDAKYYLSQYSTSDLETIGKSPLAHYIATGWKEGKDPSSKFSTNDYLLANPDVAEAEINPLLHYASNGKRQKRPLKISSLDLFALTQHQSKHKEKKLTPKKDISNLNALDIHWVIPDFSIGSGGHMTIFRMVKWLENFGHTCTIWLSDDIAHPKGKGAREDIINHFQDIKAQVKCADQSLFNNGGDVIIATGWQTVSTVLHASHFHERFYFVQDFEPSFFPEGSAACIARATYSKNLACICAGRWLQDKMSSEYGRWARSFDLALDSFQKATSNEKEVKKGSQPRLACYFRPETPRRCSELLLAGLNILASKNVDFHVDFFGSKKKIPKSVTFRNISHGILNNRELAALYKDASIGICFSATNHSLIPKEMMAHGLPVIELNLPNNTKIFPKDVITFAEPTPQGIAEALELVLSDEEKRIQQAKNASDWVAQFSWEKSARSVEAAIIEKLRTK